jgi:hypothetical protein
MFRIVDRWFKHRATMEIMNMAVAMTSDAIFRGEKEDITTYLARVDTTAETLAIAHIKVCKKLDEMALVEPTDKEVSVLSTIFKRSS